MKEGSLSTAEKYTSAHRRRRLWYRVVTCLACVVVFCTVYALILPAITLENTGCEIPEHVHTQECYTQVTSAEKRVPVCTAQTLNIHQHTRDCYDGEGNLICGCADFVVHHHDSACYDGSGNLWCPLPEIEAHTHTESCYAQPEVHTHTDECRTRERGELICTEHVHTDECYRETVELVCGLEESEGHRHDESCLDESGEIRCEEAESEGHHHDDSCRKITRELICGNAGDHQHTDECYTWNEVLTCDLSTEADEEAEPVLTCGKTEIILHQHTADCYDGDGNLICGKIQVLEHQHTDACFETVTEPVDTKALTCTLPEDENHTHGPLCYGTWELTCGMEEHSHTEDCSGDPEADVETREEWEQTFADVKRTGDWRQDVMAIAKTQLDYTESIKNYVVREDGTRHGYTRYGDWYGSRYGDWCAMFVSFCIHYADVEDMPLNSDCGLWITELEELERYRAADSGYTPEAGDLIFFDLEQDGLSDRVGLVSELVPASGEESAKITAIEGDSDGQVRYVTRDLDDPAILGYGLLPEQTFSCGKTGHVHTEDCGGEGVCPLEEHIHTDSCQEEAPTELSFEGPDYTVTVRCGADAALPEGVELVAAEIPVDSEEYQTYYAQAAEAMEGEQTVVFARFFDISFQLDGVKYEPAAPVSVTITYAEAVETGEDADCQAIHFTEEGTEVLDATAEQREDGSTSFTHIQEGFSVVGTVVALPADNNSTDVGPDSLPVDYYVCIDGEWVSVGSTKTGWYNNWNGTEGWTNYNRDYITVAQAVSILGPYGFTGNEANPSRVTAYQQKSGNTNVYSDTDTVTYPEGQESGTKIMPLSRNDDHAGYNLYYLPNNTEPINGVTSPEKLDKTANGFYTVKVYDAQGNLLTSEIVKTGDSFTYNDTESSVTSWLVAYGSGSTGTISGSTITIDNITSPVTISPNPGGAVGSHSVTFKVMIDGQWKTVGSLPYYYSGTFNGSQRAYITSAMAAQMFGDYGYTATTAPGYQFGYSYNDLYNIIYCDADSKAPTNFCMDVAGAKYEQGTAIQVYTLNGSDAQLFRIRDAEAVGHEGYSYITPFRASSLQVNLSGEGEENGQKIVLWASPTIHSSWKVIPGDNGTVSFQLKENQEFYMDVSGNKPSVQPPTQLQIWNNAGARYWKLLQQYRISNDTASTQNGSTYNIGLTPESNGDIVCYYMPEETTSTYTNATESGIDAKNSFWSVSVRDDTHSVYSDGELSHMVTIVKTGEGATVTVHNADGILWSCRGVNGQPVEVESTQSEGDTTFVIKNITQPVEVTATKANPSFTVQYYANIPRFATSGENPLKVIDTSGKELPTNGGNMRTRNIFLEGIGRNTDQNAGTPTELYRVATQNELTKMYSDGTYHYQQSPGLTYFNKLKDNDSYELQEIWVLKPGRDAASTDRNDWDTYTYSPETAFTNEASQVGVNTILINDGAVIRLVSGTSKGDYYNGTTFYDYNISSGLNTSGRWSTGITGINSEGNYGTSLNGQRTWSSDADVFAFGNANCGTGMSGYRFEGGFLNKFNGTTTLYKPGGSKETVYGNNPNYGGANFGIASSLNPDGTICYNEWIVAPKLFNDGDAVGKQTYSGSSLTFDRVGDTYTLSAATLKKNDGSTAIRNDLQYFFHPSPSLGCIWDGKNSGFSWQSNIFTNNFWPMDAADSSEKKDGLWGAYGNEGSFQGFYEKTPASDFTGYDLTDNFPTGDDGRDHNWFFGMNFAISFSLTADYEGPLEYYFFGDDDLWVFLDGRLVCDIGGVHSSIGEYVNLRDYLPVGSSGHHTLTFFYTERGASGSTCYMSFTLPSVSSATTSRDTGSLQITKTVNGKADMDYSNEEYEFQVELLNKEGGTPLNQTFSYSRSDNTYGTIKSGGTIKLKAGQTATISGIPTGTYYRVTETEESRRGYSTTVNNSQGYIVSGTIATGTIEPASFVNTPYYELPSTGGSGTYLYTIGGLLMTAAAYLLLYSHTKRRKENAPSS